jgi:hypothetical protein
MRLLHASESLVARLDSRNSRPRIGRLLKNRQRCEFLRLVSLKTHAEVSCIEQSARLGSLPHGLPSSSRERDPRKPKSPSRLSRVSNAMPNGRNESLNVKE